MCVCLFVCKTQYHRHHRPKRSWNPHRVAVAKRRTPLPSIWTALCKIFRKNLRTLSTKKPIRQLGIFLPLIGRNFFLSLSLWRLFRPARWSIFRLFRFPFLLCFFSAATLCRRFSAWLSVDGEKKRLSGIQISFLPHSPMEMFL